MSGMATPMTLEQRRFRFRTIAAATAAANATFNASDPTLGANITAEVDTIFRVRVQVQANASTDGTQERRFQLRYSLGGAAYAAVTGSTPIQAAGSAVTGYTEDASTGTVNRLGAGSGTIIAGNATKTDAICPTSGTQSWADGERYTEHEFALLLDSAQVSADDQFDLRVYLDDGTPLDTYTVTARVTASLPAAPFDLTEAALLKHGRAGPFNVGGDLYAVLINAASPSVVGVLKSEDSGASWLTVGDLIELSTNCVALAAVLDGSGNIHIAHQQAGTGSRVGYSRFATGTDSMAVNNVQVTDSAIDTVTPGHEVVTIDVDGSDLIVGATYIDFSIGQASSFYHSNNSGSSWTPREPYADIRVGAVPIGDDGTVHFLAMTLASVASQTWNAYGAGANDSYNDIEAYGTATDAIHMGQWLKFVDSGVFLAVPYVGPNTNERARLVHWESVLATPPTVDYTVVTDVSDNDVMIVSGTPQVALLRNSTGDWFLIYVDSSGEIRWVAGSFGSWGTDETSGITGSGQITVQLIDDGTVGVLFDTGSGVEYDTFAVAAAGAGVNLAPASGTSSAVPLDPVPGVVSVDLTPASATGSAVALDPQPVGASVDLTPAESAATAVPLDAVPQAVVVTLTPAEASALAVALDPAPGAASVDLTPAEASAAAVALSPGAGATQVDLTPASSTGAAVALDPVPQPVQVDLAPAEATGSGVALDPQPGLVTVTLTPAEATAIAVPLDPVTTGAINLTPAVASGAAVPLDPVPGVVSVDLTPAAATGAAVALSPGAGATTVNLAPAEATATAPALDPAPLSVQMDLTPAGATATAVPVSPSGTGAVNLAPAVATATGVPLDPSPGLVTTTLTPAEAASSAPALDPLGLPGVVALTPAETTGQAAILVPVPGAPVVTLVPATAQGQAVPLSTAVGLITVNLTPAEATAVAVPVHLGAISKLTLTGLRPIMPLGGLRPIQFLADPRPALSLAAERSIYPLADMRPIR